MAATALALSSRHQMPAVGLGVWRMDSPAIRGLIHSALRAGYRHFDCAGTLASPSTSTPIRIRFDQSPRV
jgi:diketogulonate reductase-like aldo/keto reductase